MRIDKFLSNMGKGSRSDVKKLLKSGAVTIDDIIVKQSNVDVDNNSKVCVNNKEIIYKQYIYIIMNKPKGVISATNDKKDNTVVDLLDDKFKIWNVFPVGRLDKDTEGLLILTNDGQLSHNMLSPKKHVPKTYYAEIDSIVNEYDINKFKMGVELDDGYKTLPAKLNIIESSNISKIELTITEGKFHQVKRMFESVGKKVVYLKRISMGGIVLDNSLKVGEYREMTDVEVNILKS